MGKLGNLLSTGIGLAMEAAQSGGGSSPSASQQQQQQSKNNESPDTRTVTPTATATTTTSARGKQKKMKKALLENLTNSDNGNENGMFFDELRQVYDVLIEKDLRVHVELDEDMLDQAEAEADIQMKDKRIARKRQPRLEDEKMSSSEDDDSDDIGENGKGTDLREVQGQSHRRFKLKNDRSMLVDRRGSGGKGGRQIRGDRQ